MMQGQSKAMSDMTRTRSENIIEIAFMKAPIVGLEHGRAKVKDELRRGD